MTHHRPFVPDTDERYVLTREVHLPVPVERAWQAISEPGEIARWFPNEGAELVRLEPGGTGILTWAGHPPFPIVIEAVEPPTYLAWTWGHESTEHPATLVEWRLEATEAGGTRLTMTESGIRTPEHFADNAEGWDEELTQLVDHLATAPAD